MRKRQNGAAGAGNEADERNSGQHRSEKKERDSEKNGRKANGQHCVRQRSGFTPAHKARDERPGHRQPEQQNAQDEHPDHGADDASVAVRHLYSLAK